MKNISKTLIDVKGERKGEREREEGEEKLKKQER